MTASTPVALQARDQRLPARLEPHRAGVSKVAGATTASSTTSMQSTRSEMAADARSARRVVADRPAAEGDARRATDFEQQLASRELIRNLAHEIKNPLGGIRGAAQLLERELSNPGLRE